VKRVLRRAASAAEPPALLSTPKPSLTYRLISYLLVFPIYRLLFRGRTGGNANVPLEGALVVVANHGSHLDPPLLGHALGRPVAFMAKAELFKVPLLGPIIRACGAYPVARGASDREAIRTATRPTRRGLGDRRVHRWHPPERRTGQQAPGRSRPAGRPGRGAAAAGGDHQQPPRPWARARNRPALVPIHIRIGTLIPPPAVPQAARPGRRHRRLPAADQCPAGSGL
jgi:1-acyl-sn-glycerol-3-phosphate acyltransferase